MLEFYTFYFEFLFSEAFYLSLWLMYGTFKKTDDIQNISFKYLKGQAMYGRDKTVSYRAISDIYKI